MEFEPKTRKDLINQTGSITRKIKIVDAKEYPMGVYVRVSDNMGEEYWMELEEVELDK